MKRNRITLLVVIVCLSVLAVGCPLLVFFPDKALEGAIRTNLSMPLGLITTFHLLQIRTLDARNMGIRNLSGLENCRNLAWLDLDTNSISDLGPLEQLGRPESPADSPLVFLNLDSNEITDITPLSGLLNLRQLSLFNNQVADIGPLVTNVQAGGALQSVILDAKTLDDRSINVYIPILQSEYGVEVTAAVAQTSTGTSAR